MPSTRQLVSGGLGLVLFGTGACTLAVCAALGPHTEVVDPTVRSPEAPAATVLPLPGWVAAETDSLPDGTVRWHVGTIGPVAIRETPGELVLQAFLEHWGSDRRVLLPTLRIDTDALDTPEADTTAWEAAGPLTTLCPNGRGTPASRTEGDPWDPDVPRTRFPRAVTSNSLSKVTAGAHVLSASPAADSTALAVVSGAGPKTETRVIMGGWEAVEGNRYVEVLPLSDGATRTKPVRIPSLDEPARMDGPLTCWSPSGRFVLVVLRHPRSSEEATLVVLPVREGPPG